VDKDGYIGTARISDLRPVRPADITLQNLLGLLQDKLGVCSKLPIYEYEAQNDGHIACAAAFRDLAQSERAALDALLLCLREHLNTAADAAESGFRDAAGDLG
jgi:hypothetical protein